MKDKVTTQKDLASLLEVRRRQGQRIVFTYGCFDLMHIGHIRYLQAARKHLNEISRMKLWYYPS